MIGQRVSHYSIVERIGEGGMAVVYKAEDIRLKRPVALKFLSKGLTSDAEAKQRFIQEAQIVSRLQHSNICTIHEIDETEDGQLFICMDFYEGDTLKERIAAGLPTIAEALEMIKSAAQALDMAHAHGVVHRDIKPANLIVGRDGSLKVMDFGIAVFTGETRLTQAGSSVGTAAYMSPEQARGENTDARSDVFSLGVVLYELLCGVHPFAAEHDLAIMYRITHETPNPIRDLRSDVPHAVADAVDKAMSKQPSQRYDGMRQFRDALIRPVAEAPGRTGAEIDSLAVLPFINDSGDPEVDYLSDGLTDSLIDNLCQLPDLRVMARSTVFKYANDTTLDPVEIGKQLGVRAVLAGRFTQRGDKIVIRAELVDATDGTGLWAERIRRPLSELLDIEDEISREISENLRLKLNPRERGLLAKRHTASPEAHRSYLKGRHVWNRWKTPDGMRTAIGFFEQALVLDPLYARAFAGLADSYSMLGNVKAVPPEEAYPKAKTAALQGLAIDDSLAELHTSLGFIQRFWEWDWSAAEASFVKAIELNPGYATAYRWYGQLLGGLARFDDAIATSSRAVELDPLSPLLIGALGDMYFYARRYEDAIASYQRAIAMEHEFVAGHTDLARAYELTGRFDEAIAEFELAAVLAPKGPPEPSSGLAHVFAQMGEHEKASKILEQLLAMRAQRYVSPYGIASIYCCLGDIETAFQWLETAYREHDQTLVWVAVHPRLDPLRDDARYRDLVRRMNLPDLWSDGESRARR